MSAWMPKGGQCYQLITLVIRSLQENHPLILTGNILVCP